MDFTFTLTEELFDQWVVALRDEKYSQTSHTLHDTEGYCCLGVLADVAGCDWFRYDYNDDIWESYDDFMKGYGNKFATVIDKQESEEFLPYSILDETLQNTLSEMNDKGVSFSEIADWLVEHKEQVLMSLKQGWRDND